MEDLGLTRYLEMTLTCVYVSLYNCLPSANTKALPSHVNWNRLYLLQSASTTSYDNYKYTCNYTCIVWFIRKHVFVCTL